jgi:hypothetical protein
MQEVRRSDLTYQESDPFAVSSPGPVDLVGAPDNGGGRRKAS